MLKCFSNLVIFLSVTYTTFIFPYVYIALQDDSGSGDDADPDTPKRLKRKKIRKIKSEKKLTSETKSAVKAEEERRKRIAEKQKIVRVEFSNNKTKHTKIYSECCDWELGKIDIFSWKFLVFGLLIVHNL